MSVTFPYYPYGDPSPSGWHCGTCGSWVPNGCTHSCPTSFRWTWNTNTVPAKTAEDRIADALELIAKALADLAEGKSAT